MKGINDSTKRIERVLLLLGASSATATIVLAISALATNGWSIVVRLCFLTFALVASSRILSTAASPPVERRTRFPVLTLFSLVPVLFATAVLVRLEELQRGLLDILVLGTLWSLILLQCLTAPRARKYRITILVESMSVALFSMFAVNLLYPVFNGYRDYLFHVQASTSILETYTIQSESLYANFPMLHVLTAQFAMMTGLSVSTSLALVVGLSLVATIPLVYKMGLFFIPDERAALVAAVLFASSSELLQWGTNAVPTVLGFAFAFFAVTQVLLPGFQLRRRGFVLIFLWAAVLTHILAAGLLVLMLGLIGVSMRMRRRDRSEQTRSEPKVSAFAVLSLAVVVGYWSFIAFGVVGNYVTLLKFALEPIPTLTSSTIVGPQAPIILGLGTAVITSLYLVSIALLTFGRHAGVSGRRSIMMASVVFVLGLSPTIVATPVFGQDPYALQRWTLFGMPFVALLIGGLYVLTTKAAWRRIIALLLIVAIFSGTSLAAFDADSTLAGNQRGTPTNFFSASETAADGFLVRFAHGPVVTDFIFSALLLYESPSYLGGNVSSDYGGLLSPNGYLVIRTGELAQRGLRFTTPAYGIGAGVTVNPDVVARQIESTSQVYDNGQVVILLTA